MQRDLVAAAQAGDHDAFEALVAPCFDRLYALAQRILRDRDRVDDAVQECLVRAWRDLRGLRDPNRFGAWLYRALVNACRDEARRSRRHAPELRVIPTQLVDPGSRTDGIVDRDEIERGFRRLSVDQRAVLVMHHYLGMRAPEIAMTLGVPVGTIHSRLHYATEAMRAVLEADARMPAVVMGGRTA